MTTIRNLCCALCAGGLAVFAGCSSDEAASENEYPQPAATQGDEATPAEPMSSYPTATPSASAAAVSASPPAVGTPVGPESLRDSQIMQVLRSVDQAEIEQATLARNKASDPRVKTFAEQMIEQHSRSMKSNAGLARTLGVQPEDSKLAGELQAKTGETLRTLRGADAEMFDRAYMTAQVKQHQEVLELLDTRLIPSAGNAELRATLTDTRSMVSNHLAEAQAAQSNLRQ